ncbi:MAG: RNase P protein component [Candidatus Westeberhardia cardiocondylae]|nr:RNase P protein component [Candidatus Westeberhardia cardiocondylae]
MKFSFSKKYRLLKNHQFLFVFRNAKKFNSKYFTIFSCFNNMKYSRLGIIVSKKNVKKSYLRNHIKRLIRESFRYKKKSFIFVDFVVFVKIIKDFDKNVFIKDLRNIWINY